MNINLASGRPIRSISHPALHVFRQARARMHGAHDQYGSTAGLANGLGDGPPIFLEQAGLLHLLSKARLGFDVALRKGARHLDIEVVFHGWMFGSGAMTSCLLERVTPSALPRPSYFGRVRQRPHARRKLPLRSYPLCDCIRRDISLRIAHMFAHAKALLFVAALSTTGVNAVENGLVTIRSDYAPKPTMERVEAEIKARNLIVFAHVPHEVGAAKVGLELRPTDLVIFGSPKAGTSLMQSAQTIGIDLPLKILVWQDADGATWVTYNDPSWLAKRHGIGAEGDASVGTMAAALASIAKSAATNP
jgi:uncharacterized protein (DUF302 family)